MSPLDSTLGAAFLGGLGAAVLYGVTSVQAFLYFHDCRDSRLLKTMVMVLWILDSIHLAFTAHALYYYLITTYGDAAVLQSPTWTLLSQTYLTCLSDLIVRAYFSHRVFILCRRKKNLAWSLAILIPLDSDLCLNRLLIVQFWSIGDTDAEYNLCRFGLKTFARMVAAAPMLYTSLASAVLADTLIAVSLCTLLLTSRTGFKRTDSLLATLTLYTINTGLLTSICAMATMVTYAIWPERFIFLGFYLALSKLYVNSLLASLNARSSLRPSSNDNDVAGKYAGSTPITFPIMEMLPTSTKDSGGGQHLEKL